MSQRGNVDILSIEDWLVESNKSPFEPRVVHRLDMDTSGVLLIAKNNICYKNLQSQFEMRTVKKMYTAILEKKPKNCAGEILLPLASDYINRPRQIVDYISGKSAHTLYKIVGQTTIEDKSYTRVLFYPLTGRTHQLRLHAAHGDGLNAPILGDRLYGREESDRLHLHATELIFFHPINGREIKIYCNPDF